MGWEACRVCGKNRKVGAVITDDGESVWKCLHCGDAEYWRPLADEDDVDA
jgi:hypothetical protein